MYTEVKTIVLKANESISASGDHLPSGVSPGTYEVPPGVYTLTWGAAGQLLHIDAECSAGDIQFSNAANALGATMDVLVERNKFTVSIDTVAILRPESYEALARCNAFKMAVGGQLGHGSPYTRAGSSYAARRAAIAGQTGR